MVDDISHEGPRALLREQGVTLSTPETWTGPVPLDNPQTAGSQFCRSVAVDPPTGDIAAGWYDCHTARGHGGHGCVLGAASDEDEGGRFSEHDFGGVKAP